MTPSASPRVSAINWLAGSPRTLPVIGLLLTAAALFALLTRASFDANLLARRGIEVQTVEGIYGGLLLLLALVTVFAPRLQSTLSQRWWVVSMALPAASLCAFTLVQLVDPNQSNRLFQTPFSLWIIIAHGVALVGLTVLFVIERPADEASGSLLRGALVICAVLALALISLYFLSWGEFMSIDLPDEPFVGSMATNYAQRDDLSPSYFASSYGSPDVIHPRYYLAMGLWLKLLGSTDWMSMRSFPLLLGALSAGLFFWIVRRQLGERTLTLAALVAFLSLSTFLRASHNVRSDILLASYGVLALGCLLTFLDRPRALPAAGLGLALFIGMQGIPTVALPVGLGIGVALALWMLAGQGERWRRLGWVALYAACSALSIAAYFIGQFLPDIGQSWEIMRAVTIPYVEVTGLGTPRFPFERLFTYIFQFSLSLSPAELLTAVGAGLVVWTRGVRTDRWLITAVVAALGIWSILFYLSFGYFVVFTPFAAYLIGRSLRQRWTLALGAFVLLPAMAAAPIGDLTTAMRERPNAALFADVEAAVGAQIPDGITVVGEPVFWNNLHQRTYFIGWFGLGRHIDFNQLGLVEGLTDLDVDAAICNTTLYAARCDRFAALTDYFTRSTTFEMRGEQFTILWRQ